MNRGTGTDIYTLSSVQSLSHSVMSPSTEAHQASLSITNSRSLLKLMSIESVMPSNRLILCRPLLLPPSIFPSIGVFSNESVLCIRWPKYWSFSFSISPSIEYSELISFRMDWLDLLAVQRTLKSLLQHHSSKASVLWHSGFFRVQLSHSYMTTGTTIALTRRTFVGTKMRLLWWLSGKESACQCKRCRRHRFDPWVGKIPWKTAWQHTPVFMPGESHGQRSPVGHSPSGHKELDATEHTCIK